MQPEFYRQTYEIERRHWWFFNRWALVERFLGRMSLQASSRILDVGCGTGGTTAWLARWGRVTGIDASRDALAFARRRDSSARLVLGDATRLQRRFRPGSFDLVTFFNVLYHRWIPDDEALLRQVHALLKPGGRVLLTEPAFRGLWRRHDSVDMGKTRYTLGEMKCLLSAAGFVYDGGCYFNVVSFIPAWTLALKEKILPAGGSKEVGELAVPPWPVNEFMMLYGRIEAGLQPLLRLPFGVTLLAVGRKAGT